MAVSNGPCYREEGEEGGIELTTEAEAWEETGRRREGVAVEEVSNCARCCNTAELSLSGTALPNGTKPHFDDKAGSKTRALSNPARKVAPLPLRPRVDDHRSHLVDFRNLRFEHRQNYFFPEGYLGNIDHRIGSRHDLERFDRRRRRRDEVAEEDTTEVEVDMGTGEVLTDSLCKTEEEVERTWTKKAAVEEEEGARMEGEVAEDLESWWTPTTKAKTFRHFGKLGLGMLSSVLVEEPERKVPLPKELLVDFPRSLPSHPS